MLKRLKVIRGCTIPYPLTWPSIKKFNGIEKLATTGSVDGYSVLSENQSIGTRMRVDITRVLIVKESPMKAAGERQHFNSKPPLGAPLLISPRGHLLKSFPQEDTSAKLARA